MNAQTNFAKAANYYRSLLRWGFVAAVTGICGAVFFNTLTGCVSDGRWVGMFCAF
jgi:hypothetical protein